MKKQLFLMTVAVMITGFPFVADARHGKGQAHHREMGAMSPYSLLIKAPWDRIEEMAQQIELDEDQLSALKNLRTEHRHTIEPLRSQIHLKMADLHELMVQDIENAKKQALDLSENISSIKADLYKERITLHYELSELLTDDQKTELKKHVREHRDQKRQQRQQNRQNRKHHRERMQNSRDDFDD
jgi:Spy/CpxP family protein refolding chaperone